MSIIPVRKPWVGNSPPIDSIQLNRQSPHANKLWLWVPCTTLYPGSFGVQPIVGAWLNSPGFTVSPLGRTTELIDADAKHWFYNGDLPSIQPTTLIIRAFITDAITKGGYITVTTAGNSRDTWIETNSNDFRFLSFGGTILTATNAVLTTNRVYHLAAVYDGTNAALYVDGVLVAGPSAFTWNFTAGSGTSIRVGSDDFSNGVSWPIRDARVYHGAAFSSAEIKYDYENPFHFYAPRRTFVVVPAVAGAVYGSGTIAAVTATGQAAAEAAASGSPSAPATTATGAAGVEAAGSGSLSTPPTTATGAVDAHAAAAGSQTTPAATGAGVVDAHAGASGSQQAPLPTAAGSAEAEVAASGSPSIQLPTASGTAFVIAAGRIASGSLTAPLPTATGAAGTEAAASGSPSAPPATGTGSASVDGAAAGSPQTPAATASGQATVDVVASGSGTTPAAIGAGQAGKREATGAPSIAAITAAGQVTIDVVASGAPTLSAVTGTGVAVAGELGVFGPSQQFNAVFADDQGFGVQFDDDQGFGIAA